MRPRQLDLRVIRTKRWIPRYNQRLYSAYTLV